MKQFMRSGSTKSFLDRVTELELPSSITETLAPLRAMIEVLTEELARADERFATLAAETPVVTRLMLRLILDIVILLDGPAGRKRRPGDIGERVASAIPEPWDQGRPLPIDEKPLPFRQLHVERPP